MPQGCKYLYVCCHVTNYPMTSSYYLEDIRKAAKSWASLKNDENYSIDIYRIKRKTYKNYHCMFGEQLQTLINNDIGVELIETHYPNGKKKIHKKGQKS